MKSPEALYKGIVTDLVREVNDLKKRFRDVTGNNPLFEISNENTPTALAGDQNDYDPGDYDVLRLNSSLAVNITGISGGKKGRFLDLFNVGSFNITLAHQSASSTAANRIISWTGAAITLGPDGRARLYYDSTTARWRV